MLDRDDFMTDLFSHSHMFTDEGIHPVYISHTGQDDYVLKSKFNRVPSVFDGNVSLRSAHAKVMLRWTRHAIVCDIECRRRGDIG
jgi:hypothetical protein